MHMHADDRMHSAEAGANILGWQALGECKPTAFFGALLALRGIGAWA